MTQSVNGFKMLGCLLKCEGVFNLLVPRWLPRLLYFWLYLIWAYHNTSHLYLYVVISKNYGFNVGSVWIM